MYNAFDEHVGFEDWDQPCLIIDTTNTNETRIAVTDNGKLDDFEVESNKKNTVKGDVYLAKITRI